MSWGFYCHNEGLLKEHENKKSSPSWVLNFKWFGRQAEKLGSLDPEMGKARGHVQDTVEPSDHCSEEELESWATPEQTLGGHGRRATSQRNLRARGSVAHFLKRESREWVKHWVPPSTGHWEWEQASVWVCRQRAWNSHRRSAETALHPGAGKGECILSNRRREPVAGRGCTVGTRQASLGSADNQRRDGIGHFLVEEGPTT